MMTLTGQLLSSSPTRTGTSWTFTHLAEVFRRHVAGAAWTRWQRNERRSVAALEAATVLLLTLRMTELFV
jgi:hypothetical protein